MKLKNMPWTLIVSFISGVAVIAAGIVQYADKLNDDKRMKANFNALSKENEELKKQVAGDGSMPQISILGNRRGGGDLKIVLNNPSKYPISNITISYWDHYPPVSLQEFITSRPPNKEKEIIKSQQPLTLRANEQDYLIDEISLGSPNGNPNEEHSVFTLTYAVKWRNGSYTCIIPFKWDHINHGFRVYDVVYRDVEIY